MKRFFRRALFYLEGLSGRWWYGPLLAFFAAADAFVFIVSVEALLLPAVIVRPRKWMIASLWATAGSACGATFFAALTSRYGAQIVDHFFPKMLNSPTWVATSQFLLSHGVLGLGLVSFGPFPQHIAVAAAGLAHMNIQEVFLAVLLGRGVKYLLLSWAAVHSPKVLRKMRILPGASEEYILARPGAGPKLFQRRDLD